MDAKELTELAMERSGETSIRTFAKRVGVSHVAVTYWLAGTSVPTFEQAAELAALAGLPIIKTASEVRLHSPAGMKHRSILERMAGAALVALCAVGIAGTPTVSRAETGSASPSMSIMSIGYYLWLVQVVLGNLADKINQGNQQSESLSTAAV